MTPVLLFGYILAGVLALASVPLAIAIIVVISKITKIKTKIKLMKESGVPNEEIKKIIQAEL